MKRPTAQFWIAVAMTMSVTAFATTALPAQQSSALRDSLHLADLQSAALHADPRARQLGLLASQSALRQQDISATRLPSLDVNALGQYQSEVVTIPLTLPNGLSVPVPSHDVYDAHVAAQEALYDPSLSAKRGVERAQLAAAQAGVRSTLFTLRQDVNNAYFSVLMEQAQRAEEDAAIQDLEAQRAVAASRLKQGTALPSEAEMLEAEVLRRRQAVAELDASRDAELQVLSDLTGRTITSADALAVPDLGADVARVRAASDALHARPEYKQFDRNRDVLAEQQASLSAADLPKVSAFGRGGYGRPGLNPLAQDFSGYWLAGVQVDWAPWNWGTTRRDREALTIQRQIIESDEAAFEQSVRRGVALQLASVDRLQASLAEDDAIVALRERILTETRFRFGEGVITSADYVNRETDVLTARLARVTHTVQLAQARAQFLTSLGIEVQE